MVGLGNNTPTNLWANEDVGNETRGGALGQAGYGIGNAGKGVGSSVGGIGGDISRDPLGWMMDPMGAYQRRQYWAKVNKQLEENKAAQENLWKERPSWQRAYTD